jgi:phosphonoacetaldehyde hydrolase
MFSFARTYRGPLQAVIFDWAGTTVDYGSCAPAAVFVKLFQNHGVFITMDEARGPMGMHKRDHIQAIAALPRVQQLWRQEHGAEIDDAAIEGMFEEFVPLLAKVIADSAQLIPHLLPLVDWLRQRGVKIGSTTGYNRLLMAIVQPLAAQQGFTVDSLVCACEVAQARPAPWMALRCAEQLGVYPLESIVKVGDTLSDVHEGLNAGMWSVGVVQSGNEVGLTQLQIQQLPPAELQQRCNQAAQKLAAAGAHYVVQTLQELPGVITAIEARLQRGERP